MLNRLQIFVPVLLAAQAWVVHSAASGERPPAAPDLSRFPATLGAWKMTNEDVIDPEVQAQLHADRLLSRSYLSGASNQFASLFVAWFQSQRAGASQPHSPKVCLPSNGWTPESTSEITLDTGQGVIPVNRIVAAYGVGRAVVLYWYQTPRRAVADELQAKLWLIADAMRDKRTDTSLVRIVVNVAGKQDDAATAAGMQFARDLYPVLREQLPR